MLKELIIVVVLAYASADVIKRDADDDECYRCSTWDALGQGFIEAADNPPNCGHYKECWKSKNTGKIQSIDRWCAPGTYTDSYNIRRGAPCTTTILPTGCNPNEATFTTPIIYPCPYVQMTPDWLFGMYKGAALVPVGTCGPQGYFNDTLCTCTIMTRDCTCKIAMPLTTDIKTHGCNGGWVGQLGMPAMVTIVNPGPNGWAHFTGFDPALNNGGHLGTYVIDGAFAGEWIHSLKLTAAFTVDSSFGLQPPNSVWGVVSFGDCAAGSAFGFTLVKDGSGNTQLVASLELMTAGSPVDYTLSAPVTVGQTYYAASIYIESNNPSWVLYVMTLSDFQQCANPPNNCPVYVTSANPQGTVTPRGCGFVIGHTGTDSQNEFFVGDIKDVTVDIGPLANSDIFPCT